MTVSSTVKDTGLLPGDGANFTFSFSPIQIFASSELRVYHVVTATGVQTLIPEGTGAASYKLNAIATYPSTGSIVYPEDEVTAIPSTETILIKRVPAQNQPTALANQGGYLPATHEKVYDRLVHMVLDLQEQIDRCIKLPHADGIITSTEISPSALRAASHLIQIDSAGTGITTAAAPSGTSTANASSATPADVSVSAGAAGSSADFSRADHAHLLPTTVPRLATENIWTESQVWNKGSDVASTASMTLGAGNWFDITGTNDITSITSIGIGTLIILHFDAIVRLTHSANDIVCPGAQDILTQAGTEIMLYEYASADWRVISISNDVPDRLMRAVDLSQKITFEDDFIGTIKSAISSTAGSGSGTAAAAISSADGGAITLVSSTADGNNAANSSILTLDTLDWAADQGELVWEVRLQVDNITNLAFFVGFTDVISTTVELPVFKTSGADTLDSDAANACGVGFDTDGTTDEFWHGGVKANTDTAAVHSGSAPVNGTDVIIRVEVSAAGAVRGFINGTAIGSATANAITTNTRLTPVVVVSNRSGSQRTLTLDYVHAQANR